MVDSGTAGSSVSKNTRLVGLEVNGVSLDRDGDGLLSNGGLKGCHAVGGSLSECGDVDGGGLGLIVNASAVGGGVSVVGFEVSVVALQVSESAGLPTTVATEAGLNAVDELLLGEGKELAGGDLPSTFEGASRGEGPAGTALTLILDGGDGTSSGPVYSGGP